ncbi:MAG TPA: hypothetical protein VFO86_15445 [Terriglobia bacterium]|nr:hypothetical protein [Terriglobia bacterium]
MAFEMKRTKWIASAVLFLLLALFMFAIGPIVLLLTIGALGLTIVGLPILLWTGRRRRAGQLLFAWGLYLPAYLLIATGITMAAYRNEPNLPIGKDLCADAGCFAVEKIDSSTSSSATTYTVYWHLSSNDKQVTKHFPGKGLELYMIDERGRNFALLESANPYPLDVTIPAGETVRQSMTFQVPNDAHELYLTAKYRPFTYQSLLPGELSLVPHRPGKMIRIL